MLIIETMTSIGLLASQPIAYMFALIIGCLLNQKKPFAHALVLMLFTMIYNYWLKSLWQIPLPEQVNPNGWAFPSGHMHTAWVFWGTIGFMLSQKWIKLLTLTLTALCGFALIQAGFHELRDVLGALAFGTLSMLIYQVLLTRSWVKKNAFIMGLGLTVLGASLLQFAIQAPYLKPFLWQAMGTLAGLSLGWTLIDCIAKKPLPFLALISLAGLSWLALATNQKQAMPILLQFMSVGLALSLFCQDKYHLRWLNKPSG